MRHVTGDAGDMSGNGIPEQVSERSRTFLNELLTASCGAARKAGVSVCTISLTPGGSSSEVQNAPLRSCAGTEEHPGAKEYFFEATNSENIERAFQKIGEEITRIRRAS